jgi:NitT/TauT family transport system ATP-binding protein
MSSPQALSTSDMPLAPTDGSDVGEALISARNISHVFAAHGTGEDLLALANISVDIRRGEMVAFIGPSGCGKSTLLNVIGGLINPTRGAAFIDNVQVKGPAPKKVAYIFQEGALLPWATVLDNVKVGLEFQGIASSERQPRAQKALAAVGLTPFAKHYPHQLSGGMKQRVALARALSLETDVLLMDEPFAALDEQTRMVFGEDLSRMLSKTSKTILLVTHSLAEAVFLSDRIFVFTARPGTIKETMIVGEPHPRKPQFVTSEAFNRTRNLLYEALREEVLKAMDEAGVPR